MGVVPGSALRGIMSPSYRTVSTSAAVPPLTLAATVEEPFVLDLREPLLELAPDPNSPVGDSGPSSPSSSSVYSGPCEEVLITGTTSVYAAKFNLVTTVIGSGMMALPYVFKTLGLLGASVSTMLVCFLTWISARMLVRVSYDHHKSYGLLLKDSMGPSWTSASHLCIMLNNLGLLVVFLDIISDCLLGNTEDKSANALPGLLTPLNHLLPPILTRRETVMALVMICVIAPAALRRSFDSMKWTSMYSVCYAAFFVALTAMLGMYSVLTGQMSPTVRMLPKEGTPIFKIVSTVPVIMSAFICHYNINPMMAELPEPRQRNMNSVVTSTMLSCCFLNIIVGVSAVTMFGDGTQGDVLQNFSQLVNIPHMDVLLGVIRVGYIISLACTFPVILFGLRDSLLSLLPWECDKSATSTFYITSIALLVIEYMVCIAVPDIVDVIELMASTVTMIIGFIFPALITIRAAHISPQTTTFGHVVGSSIMIWMGIIIGALGFGVACSHMLLGN